MRYIDLTQTFTTGMPVYPGDPQSSLEQIANIPSDTFTDHKLTTAMHVGTHMDAPQHMIENGQKIDELPAENFFTKGILVDARGVSQIDASVLKNTKTLKDSTVLVLTGFGDKFRETGYFDNAPPMTEDFANEMVKHGVKVVGMDTSGPDHNTMWPVHKILLGNGIVILENLCNLESLLELQDFDIVALPIKLQADAAPARVVAIVKP